MTYHIDAEKVSLEDLRKRIEATDLVPSRAALLEKIGLKIKGLKQQGITTLAQLRNELKNSRRLEAVSRATGIDAQYLILLRREIEGYFPKPVALQNFDWLPGSEIAKLERAGICDTAALYEGSSTRQKRIALAKSTGTDANLLEMLAQLADLTRVQWVSPTAARMLLEAGCKSPGKLAKAEAGELEKAFTRLNAGNRLFKGRIGLRDIKRLIQAARYV